MLDPRLAGLLDIAAYEPRPATVELRETHISWVLLAGDAAYKIKKPLKLAFLDYATLMRRRELCDAEVALNARLAPRIYRGVKAIVPAGGGLRIADERQPGAIEYAVAMRRYDERSTLAQRLADGTADRDLMRAVGARIAAFHAAARIPRSPPMPDAMLRENFATLRDLDVDVDDEAELAAAFLGGCGAELAARAAHGLVRDGHGDLRAEHVVLERGIEIVDCVEFDAALREIDVGLDLAFLAMDVMRHDRGLAHALVGGYRAAGGDPGSDALVAFFAAQRALIRVKVALIRASQVGGADGTRRRADAAALRELARRLGWKIRLGRVAVICGPAAAGKTTLATALAARSGARVLSSDVTRKRLLGLPPTARAPLSAYTGGMSRRTYATLGSEAAGRLAAGEDVVVDATFRFVADRAAFTAALGARQPLWIECRAPAAIMAQRASERARAPGRTSDADAAIALRTAREFEPLVADRHITVGTAGGTDATLVRARRALDAWLAGSRGDVDELVLERVPDQLGT